MIVGLDGSRAFLKERTGIEEYSYQVIKNLRENLKFAQVFLYIRSSQKVDFSLPPNWKIKVIRWPYLWTQVGLSLEMLLHPVDALFIPAHIVPLIIPKKTVVVVHGLEYEFVPEAYPLWERIYMRWAIKRSCRRAKIIIAVSNNTKKDLMSLYKVPAEKISVIYEGYVIASTRCTSINSAKQSNFNKNEIAAVVRGELPRNDNRERYLLFIGRLEERKNIIGIIKAFEILKEKYKIPHKLILAGKPGFGYAKAITKIQETRYKGEIILTGFVSEEEKGKLLKNANVFLFPTFYEGFGLPILEAQNVGVPVVASNNSSISEIVKFPKAKPLEFQRLSLRSDVSALLVNPHDPAAIAEATIKIIQNENLKKDLIQKGLENVKKFSWEKCAKEIAEILKKE